jgi:hypothetical protein
MHWLVDRAIQCFLRDTRGGEAWAALAAEAGLDAGGFEAPGGAGASAAAVLEIAARRAALPLELLLEDLGTYLVTHRNMQVIRRLLRFGGADFTEFLHSLDELPDRARLAVPDLDLPALALEEGGGASFTVRVTHPLPGHGHVMVGVLRAMADDYGVLALLEHRGRQGGAELVAVELADAAFAEARAFELRRRAG